MPLSCVNSGNEYLTEGEPKGGHDARIGITACMLYEYEYHPEALSSLLLQLSSLGFVELGAAAA